MTFQRPQQWAAAWAICGAAFLVAAACNNDRPTDSSNGAPGSHAVDTSVQNAHIVPRFIPGKCSIQVGAMADLRFTIANNGARDPEQLLAVSTDAARMVRMSPANAFVIQPGATLSIGQPSTTPTTAGERPMRVVLDGLDADARPGTSADVTFRFQRAGDITLVVPIEACPAHR